jgi:hypothetical protein
MPGRYAKPELSSGFPVAIDRYAYQLPAAQVSAPAVGNATTTPSKPDQTTPLAPIAANGGMVKNANPQ